ncbi:MAG: hypothetical protein IKL83_05915 [Muribaculaceae bacterium]|nr:hypothetical protein [Muribaculaceae bacterium]
MDISQAYNKTIELEGLLQLLKSDDADEAKKDVIFNALFDKIDEIDVEISALKKQFNAEKDSESVDVFDKNIEEVDETPVPEIVDEIENVDVDTDGVCDNEENDIIVEVLYAEEVIEETSDDNQEEIEDNQKKIEDNDSSDDIDDCSEPDIEVEFDCVDVDVNQSAFARKTRGDIRKMFTLNDNFKFRRELFENSQERYAQALTAIEQMESMAQAEEHFYNELNWDKENPEVNEFMAIISVYFLGR